MSKIHSIVNDLREEKTRLAEERRAAHARLRDIDAELKRVESALSTLEKKPVKEPRGKSSAPRREEVADAAKRILADEGALELEPLKDRVGTRLAELGRSKVGIGLRLNEVLSTKEFVESPAGWKLVECEATELVTNLAEGDSGIS